jgi:16S rRNA (guanine527-N7)-methyltransferase
VKQSRIKALEHYRALIERYHQTLDLVSQRGLSTLDALLTQAERFADFLIPLLSPADQLLDLGSGVGLPAIVLAISAPEMAITLVERRRKRASFLTIVAAQLELKNVTIIGADVRELEPPPAYSVITGQAVGSLLAMYCRTRHLHAPEILLAARKRTAWPTEVAALRAAGLSPTRLKQEADSHGRLVALRLAGGLTCRSSASSIRRVE